MQSKNEARSRRGGLRGGGSNRRRAEAPEVLEDARERSREPLCGLLVGASPALMARRRARGGRS